MRFTLGADALAAVVSYAAKVIPARPAHPALSGVVLTATDGQVIVHAMSNEASAQATVPAHVAQEGTVLVNGRLLSEICSSVKSEQMEVVVEGAKVRVRAGKASWTLLVMPSDDYPKRRPDADSASGTVPTAALLDAVEKVAIAADPDNAMPLLGGVHIEFSPKEISFAATDRYRLAHKRLAWTGEIKVPVAITVPSKQLTDAMRGLAKDGETITVSLVGSDQIVLSGATRTAKIGTLAGDYPPVLSLVPKSYASTAKIDGRQALEVLNRVAIVAEKNDPVALSFTDGKIAFRCGRDENSASSDEIEAALSGSEISAQFNPHYLKEGLAACGGANTTVHLVSPTKPVVLTPEGGDYTYLVMTVRGGDA